MGVLKNTGILLLNVIFSLIAFGASFVWFVSMDILERGTDEFKLAVTVLVFILVQIIYIVVRVKIKKYKKFEIVYSLVLILISIILLTVYSVKNKNDIFEKRFGMESGIIDDGIEEDYSFTVDTDIYFDKNMRKIKKVNNEYRFTIEYFYDKDGKLIMEKQSRINGETVSEIKYSYIGKIVQKKTEDSDIGRYEERYFYDSENNMIKMEKFNFDISDIKPILYEEYIYNKSNKKIGQAGYAYNKEKKIYFEIGKREFEYSKDGKLFKLKESRKEDEDKRVTEYEYAGENLAVEKQYNKKNKLIGKIVYKYDSKNQLVSEEYYNKKELYRKLSYKNSYEK